MSTPLGTASPRLKVEITVTTDDSKVLADQTAFVVDPTDSDALAGVISDLSTMVIAEYTGS